MNIKDIFKTRKFSIKIFVSHVLGIIALLVFTRVTVLYAAGEFELPFYDRTKSGNVEIEFTTPPSHLDNIPVVSEQTHTEDKTSVIDVVNPSDLTGAEDTENSGGSNHWENDAPTEPAVAFEILSDDMIKQGYAVSDGVYEIYDEAKTVSEINRYKAEVKKILSEGGDSPLLPPEPELYEYRFVEIEPTVEIPSVRNTSGSYILKQTVEPYMDFIIVRTDETETLCDSSGKIITRDFVNLGAEILKMRDDGGNTVFKKDGVYFIYDPDAGEGSNGAFVEIKFDETLTGDRGALFMYPSYYGANGANGLDRNCYYSYNKKWGYAAAGTENIKITRIYDQTFNFSENIGVAYQEAIGKGKKFFFLDERGVNLLGAGYNYYAPDTVTKDHLGFFYFDHGLTRVYEREFDGRRGFVLVERELMVDVSGRPFYVPEDYNIKAYSNGMILLEKNGYYGFMNYLGEWVAQPIYKYAQPFYEGVAVIGLDTGKKALIDTQGNLVAKFKYDVITNCTGGIVALYEKNEGWTILNKVRRTIEIEIN